MDYGRKKTIGSRSEEIKGSSRIYVISGTRTLWPRANHVRDDRLISF